MPRVAATLWLLCSWPALAAADEPLPPGVLVAIDRAEGQAGLRGLEEAGGATWELETLTARSPEAAPPPEEAIAELRRRYVYGEFLRCVAALQEPPLDVDALLDAGLREAADQVLVFGAACAFGGDDLASAERLLRRAQAAELPLAALGETTPETQAFAERVLANAPPIRRIRLESSPVGAQIRLDGRDRCPLTPCDLSARAGPHRLHLELLGFESRALTLQLDADLSRTVALAPASGPELVTQLEHALTLPSAAEGGGQLAIARVAAEAYGARVVVLLRRDGDAHVAVVYDRSRERFVSTVRDTSAERATYLASQEWRGIVEPRPVWRQPLFWTLVVGAAGVAAVIVWLAVRPPERTYSIEVL